VTVDRTHAPAPSEPVSPHTGIQQIPRPPRSAEDFLRAWARDTAGLPSVLPRRRRWARLLRQRRVLAAAAVLLLATSAAVFGSGYLISENIGDNVRRVPDVFGALDPSARPAEGRSLTFLLVGTDSRSEQPTTGRDGAGVDPGSPRSDVLMLARLNPDRTVAGVASIPRDSWVDIPGHGWDKINVAYAHGGPPLLVQTVENLTGLRIDHFAVIDFGGFTAMVDAVGGIDLNLDTPSGRGADHLDGRAALAYVRQRQAPSVPGDLDRAGREQQALRALFTRVAEQGTLSSPAGTLALLDAASRSVSVDDTLSNGGLRSLASALKDLEPSAVTFVRAPVGALGRQGGQPVVNLDPSRSRELWTALGDDRIAAYADIHPDDALVPVTR